MEAVRIVKKVTDDRVEELNKFKGQDVEIIILPAEVQKGNASLLKDLCGSCPSMPDGMEYQSAIRKEWNRQ